MWPQPALNQCSLSIILMDWPHYLNGATLHPQIPMLQKASMLTKETEQRLDQNFISSDKKDWGVCYQPVELAYHLPKIFVNFEAYHQKLMTQREQYHHATLVLVTTTNFYFPQWSTFSASRLEFWSHLSTHGWIEKESLFCTQRTIMKSNLFFVILGCNKSIFVFYRPLL